MHLPTPGFRPPQGAVRGPDYKPHIDGLRAVSIIAVLAFHAGVPGFGGGFTGVDIFFVISGYLIINQIAAGLEAGRFSIFDFYARRALRILPPFLLVLVVTLAIGVVLIRSPRDLANFVGSAVSAPIFLSNIFFLRKSGYFDVGAPERPLLHTWSLSVEEQFYLVVPVLLVGLFWFARRRGMSWATALAAAGVLIGGVSLAGAILLTPPDNHPIVADPNPAFLLTQWRAWQFVAGGVIALVVARVRSRPDLVGSLAGAAGLVLIALSIGLVGLEWLGVRLGLYDRVSGYPGVAALLPTAGAALFIGGGLLAPASAAARLLSTAPFTFVGRISYALYLWHWPLLVFGRMLPLDVSREFMSAAALALALALSIATHYWIERPIALWRRRPQLRTDARFAFRIVAAGCGACVLVAALSSYVAGGALARARENPLLARATEAKVGGSGSCLDASGAAAETCFDGSRQIGVLVGDSEAYALLPRIEYEAEKNDARLFAFTVPGCNPLYLLSDPDYAAKTPFCAGLVPKLDQLSRLDEKADFAIFQALWNSMLANEGPDRAGAEEDFRQRLTRLITAFAGAGQRRVLIIGPIPMLHGGDPFTCVDLSRTLGLAIEPCGVSRAEVDALSRRPLEILREVAASLPNARVVDPSEIFCDERVCVPFQDGGVTYMDYCRLNDFGAKLLYDRFRADFEWAFGR
ncbi:MAG: acyltransferase [Rhizobiales bacterium]|nr:acyltransferase [Hyphomicrobiales bacterium]